MQKKNADTESVAEAKHIYGYDTEEFKKLFSYRKGNKLIPYKNEASIARQYRKMENKPRYWDHFDEEIEEGE